MKRKSETELKKIAKALYFGKGSRLKIIYADEFGRFSRNKGNLLQINKGKDIKVVEIPREAVAKISTEGVNNFTENPELFPGNKDIKPNESKEAKDELKEAEAKQNEAEDKLKASEDKNKELEDKLKEAEETAKKGGFKLFGGGK